MKAHVGKLTKNEAQRRWESLKTERSSWVPHWQEISQHVLPRQGRFLVSDANKGGKRHNLILDSTASAALRVLSAGMLAGMTSPARPWFRLETPDHDLNQSYNVKLWLSSVTKMMQNVFSRSNTYRTLRFAYTELGAFGSYGGLLLPRFETVHHHHPFTAGQYAFALNEYGEVDTLFREFNMTVGELAKTFGPEKLRRGTRAMWDNGNLDQWITVVHGIEPRRDRDTTKRDARNMPFRSVYFEQGANQDEYLRESGFQSFRGLAPRWVTTPGDIYASTCPGMEALGDVKQLQHQQFKKSVGIDWQTDPLRMLPEAMRGQEGQAIPGGTLFYSGADAPKITAGSDLRFELNALLGDIQDVRGRINNAFHADLFLMLANATDTRMTATEVAERHEEKLLMLGPTIEQLHNELLKPMIDLTFQDMLAANIVPPPPEELQGMSLQVNFVSMLAQAQRAIQTNSIDRFVSNLGVVAQAKPEVLDKFDGDAWVDIYADMLGVDPEVILGGEEVALIRQERAQAQAQQQALATAEQAAGAAQKAAQVPTSGGNLATDIINQFSGYRSPSASQVEQFDL